MISRFLKDEKQRRIAAFVLKAIGMYVLWFLVYDFWLAPEGKLDAWLNKRAANDGAFLLQLIGYNSTTSPGIGQTIIEIENVPQVGLGNPCNGLELFALFTGFVLCFPGQWKIKLWFIPLGILLIHFVNAMRAAGLALIQLKAPEHLDFNHHYTFTVIVYAIIFALWMLWANRYAGLNAKPAGVNE